MGIYYTTLSIEKSSPDAEVNFSEAKAYLNNWLKHGKATVINEDGDVEFPSEGPSYQCLKNQENETQRLPIIFNLCIKFSKSMLLNRQYYNVFSTEEAPNRVGKYGRIVIAFDENYSKDGIELPDVEQSWSDDGITFVDVTDVILKNYKKYYETFGDIFGTTKSQGMYRGNAILPYYDISSKAQKNLNDLLRQSGCDYEIKRQQFCAII